MVWSELRFYPVRVAELLDHQYNMIQVGPNRLQKGDVVLSIICAMFCALLLLMYTLVHAHWYVWLCNVCACDYICVRIVQRSKVALN